MIVVGPDFITWSTFGLFPNASKTWLVVRDQHWECARKLFANACINVTKDERPHLGAVIGSSTYITQYVSSLSCYLGSRITAAFFVCCYPTYSAFTHGLICKWLFIARTIPDVVDILFLAA